MDDERNELDCHNYTAKVTGDARRWVGGAPRQVRDFGALTGMEGLAVFWPDIQAKTGMVGNYVFGVRRSRAW